ncbi:WXG100 family type VII secretion target [Mycobacterium sp. NPDC050853]|uniref:WXG100 family type VII secretion target n=1 Tax=Mycobacterium sp. NPDC050853 TaxID=3155160 RepID=UPI0033CA5DB5
MTGSTGGGILGVSPGELHRVSRLIAATGGGLAAELDALDAEVSKFMGSGWSGGSASAFTERWFQWYEGAKLVHQGLTQMSSLLASTEQAFVNQESTTAANVDAAATDL